MDANKYKVYSAVVKDIAGGTIKTHGGMSASFVPDTMTKLIGTVIYVFKYSDGWYINDEDMMFHKSWIKNIKRVPISRIKKALKGK